MSSSAASAMKSGELSGEHPDRRARSRTRHVALALFLAPCCLFAHRVHSSGLDEPAKESALSAQNPGRSGETGRILADWVVATGDNGGASFIIIDKKSTALQVYDARGVLLATTPVLLGSAVGDDTVPGIGDRPLSQVLPHERTTPAGRFVAERGRNAKGVDVVWIDYDAAVSMHRVINNVPAEKRLQRLASPTSADNRISYGCVNIPVAFYESTIRPMFATHRAMVYVMPEQRTLQQVFGIDASRQAIRGTAPR